MTKIKHKPTPYTSEGSTAVSYLVNSKEIERVERESETAKELAEKYCEENKKLRARIRELEESACKDAADHGWEDD